MIWLMFSISAAAGLLSGSSGRRHLPHSSCCPARAPWDWPSPASGPGGRTQVQAGRAGPPTRGQVQVLAVVHRDRQHQF